MKHYGFINDRDDDPEAYIFGSGQLQGAMLQPDGDWSQFLPIDEYQNLNGIEPYACASFGLLNCIETLLRRQYGEVNNFSDRYLAKVTGTESLKGNSPHVVAEALRHRGDVRQQDWDFTPDINTFEKFYATPPSFLVVFAERFVDEYDFKHDYVPNNPTAIKEALRYSPLGFSVSGWTKDNDGLYYNPGTPNNHWVMCYGYEDGKYWKIFDSYDNDEKKVRWDAIPEVVKRYSIRRVFKDKETIADLIQDKIRGILLLIKEMLNYLANKPPVIVPKPVEAPAVPVDPPLPPTVPPTAPVVPVQPLKPDSLHIVAMAIKQYEGWGLPGSVINGVRYPNGTASFRRNDPGNVRCSRVGYLPIYGEVKCENNFAVFSDYATGWLYLRNLLKSKIRDNPTWTLLDLMNNYAPVSDNNEPDKYALYIARKLSVDISYPIKNLV